ncbi:membrane-associated protein [Clostridium tetani E88]|uniref:Membrane-associated protein n=1 Tax=Clostridium tetani (strain Massachusetts / E88) TaxID=212717 RepID=Q891K1_CLOTE|nr:membrane-associated protein [Clostridium tetani E88]
MRGNFSRSYKFRLFYLHMKPPNSYNIRAFSNTISILSAMINLIFLFTELGIFIKSFSLSLGIITVSIPALYAANVFSFNPPIANTSPVNVISPVIATLCLTFLELKAETMAVIIVTPADGPSFGTAPSGTWIWISLSL